MGCAMVRHNSTPRCELAPEEIQNRSQGLSRAWDIYPKPNGVRGGEIGAGTITVKNQIAKFWLFLIIEARLGCKCAALSQESRGQTGWPHVVDVGSD